MVALRIRQPLLWIAPDPVAYSDTLTPATITIIGGSLSSTYGQVAHYADTLEPATISIIGGSLSSTFVGTPANSDPSYDIQKAIVALLRVSVTEDTYDTPPERSPFPRITIGDGQVLANFADCYAGSETYLQVDIWSREVGFGEAKTLANRVRAVLDDKIVPLDGHTMEYMRFESAQYLRDPDGITRHVAMTFRILSQPKD